MEAARQKTGNLWLRNPVEEINDQVLFIGKRFGPEIEYIEPKGMDYITYEWRLLNAPPKIMVFQASRN